MTDARTITDALGGTWRNNTGMVRCVCHDDRTPSLSIRDGDEPGRVLLTCFAGCDRRYLVAELRKRGLLDHVQGSDMTLRPVNRRPDHRPDADALALWKAAQPAPGLIVETYLRSRGIMIPVPPSIRCGSTMHAGRVEIPTMIAALQEPGGNIIAVQSLLLTHAGRKAAAAIPRLNQGAFGFGAVRFAKADDVLGLAEGIESALSAMQLTDVPCWASLGAARMQNVELPATVRELHIFADNDEPGRKAAERTAEKHKRIRVVLRFPPEQFKCACRASRKGCGMTAAKFRTIDGERQEAREAERPRLVPIPWSEIHKLPKRTPLIPGLLDTTAMSVIYGASGCGKTFFGIDIGARVSLGIEWRGRKVRQGPVLYIAAEGGLGIEERLTAWRVHHDVDVGGVPFYVIPEPIDLCNSESDLNVLMGQIEALPIEAPLEFIVVDTLSRAMSGGNENSPDDMGAFVRNCDKLRLATKAHVAIVHHAGKDDSRGARGHSLIKAATDTEIEVSKDGTIAKAAVTKQRDHASGDVFAFKLESVEIGQEEDGTPITSCVCVEADKPATADGNGPRLTKNQQTMFSILHSAGERGLSLEVWNEQTREAGIGKTRHADLYDIRLALKSKGVIYEHSNGWAVKQ